jgi:quercetin dioxygenase-like cupin family protein
MATLISTPARIPVPGGKVIDEHVGLMATGNGHISVARMIAPPGWSEPAQTPEFDEITLVLVGELIVETDDGDLRVVAGQSIFTEAGERVRYSVGDEGAEYIAICTPAFALELVNREEE